MSDLTLMLIRITFLCVLWLFVIFAVGVIRTDLLGPAKSKSKRKRSERRAPADTRAPRPARSPRAPKGRRNEPRSLVVTKGPLAGTSLNLSPQQPIIIGRANDATLVINDDYASGRHARIFSDNGRWIVEDLGSTNGTYLGQQRLTHPQPISVGQPIRIGKTVLELRK
ncbi:FHA domain-containing protein [Streptomonospora nanhaiensis]|uniref:PSer/pThr/pTyr-binding forkhead associated (FHA) protein n=1 Tax=Streptomonospora nanhaiensis TaxID=1323731 RepID=A0A853BNH8_9ACTN|nr:FHA domain-containing protein [Streptomonospora nanhaiensis]MBV2364295.1 FHA domain-containing protein [Streptomonospora nanhaiensis]MBX9390402.1 FHA domain-containing protein [Streptomonospora nanhaiensis]NYI97179.1 pSer/pThr/pTyr-binding forkhead associated (FHA) protein [Streptomonospora nanhaiensis]